MTARTRDFIAEFRAALLTPVRLRKFRPNTARSAKRLETVALARQLQFQRQRRDLHLVEPRSGAHRRRSGLHGKFRQEQPEHCDVAQAAARQLHGSLA